MTQKGSVMEHTKGLKLTVVDASWHRNGIGGAGFYAVLFDEAEHGRMIASLFDEAGYCAVYKIDELSKGNIAFARGNSWRGDVYEEALRPLVDAFLKQAGSNRLGLFSVIPEDTIKAAIAKATEGV